jgi:DNA-binding protein HU-beta
VGRKKAVTKAELVDEVFKGLPRPIEKKEEKIERQDVAKAVDTIIDTIKDSLKGMGRVSIVGLGTFLVKKNAARQGRNPGSGAKIDIPEKFQPTFRAGNILKDEVKNVLPLGETDEGIVE